MKNYTPKKPEDNNGLKEINEIENKNIKKTKLKVSSVKRLIKLTNI